VEYKTYLNIQQVYRLCPEAALVCNSQTLLYSFSICGTKTIGFLIERQPELLLGNIGELRSCFGYDQKEKQIEFDF
jgi:hypothetical protein